MFNRAWLSMRVLEHILGQPNIVPRTFFFDFSLHFSTFSSSSLYFFFNILNSWAVSWWPTTIFDASAATAVLILPSKLPSFARNVVLKAMISLRSAFRWSVMLSSATFWTRMIRALVDKDASDTEVGTEKTNLSGILDLSDMFAIFRAVRVGCWVASLSWSWYLGGWKALYILRLDHHQ